MNLPPSTIIIMSRIYRKRHWSMFLFLFLFRWTGWLAAGRQNGGGKWGRGGGVSLLPPGLSLSPAPNIPVVRVSSCHQVIFCPDPPPFSPSNCCRHSRQRRAATFNQSPKIAPRAWRAGGRVGCRSQQGPPGVMCSSPSSHNTSRGDSRPQVLIQHPVLLLQLEPQPADCSG